MSMSSIEAGVNRVNLPGQILRSEKNELEGGLKIKLFSK